MCCGSTMIIHFKLGYLLTLGDDRSCDEYKAEFMSVVKLHGCELPVVSIQGGNGILEVCIPLLGFANSTCEQQERSQKSALRSHGCHFRKGCNL